MRPFRWYSITVPCPAGMFFSFLLLALPLFSQQSKFSFTRPDLKLLDDANELERQFERKGLVYQEPALTGYLQAVADGLQAGSPAPARVQYRVRVLRDPMINAFSLPSGSIYTDTGLLAQMENEAQLASVLGHEMAHVAGRHAYLQNREIRKLSVTVNLLSLTAFVPAGQILGAGLYIARSVSGPLATFAVFGYSRQCEDEADRNGLSLMTAASYDPHAMPSAFHLLDEKLDVEPARGIYRTHPSLKHRIEKTKAIADSKPAASQRTTAEGDYLAHVADAMCFNIEADLDSRRARLALARAKRLAEWKPDAPRYSVLLADAWRGLGADTAEPGPTELTAEGKAERRRFLSKMTAEEEQAALLAKPGGPEVKRANDATAERLYTAVIARQPSIAEAHRGLGMLYQIESRNDEAAREYRRYLDMAPAGALDRLRIERRLDAVAKPSAVGQL
jgi:beta-barrel assembly-enhancing protease